MDTAKADTWKFRNRMSKNRETSWARDIAIPAKRADLGRVVGHVPSTAAATSAVMVVLLMQIENEGKDCLMLRGHMDSVLTNKGSSKSLVLVAVQFSKH